MGKAAKARKEQPVPEHVNIYRIDDLIAYLQQQREEHGNACIFAFNNEWGTYDQIIPMGWTADGGFDPPHKEGLVL